MNAIEVLMRLFILITIMLFPLSAIAADNFGISMHGNAKYSANDTHLNYANPDAPKGGALKSAAIGTFDTLNPYNIKGKAPTGMNLIYARLMARVWDEPFTMYPMIAKSYDMASDRSWISFTLDGRARFQDGTPITADDVLFSFETLKEQGRPNMRQIYRLVTNAEKTAPDTIKFTFGDGYDEETALILAMMPVLSKAYWEERNFDATTLDTPNTNGPYRIQSVDAGRSITYARNDDYWAKDHLTNIGHHNFETITYDYYRDDTVAFEAFKSGELDTRREGNAGRWFSAYDFPAIKNGDVQKSNIKHGRPEKARGFIFNTRRAPFDDIRIREALSLLFDFDWVNKNLFAGQFNRIDSYFPNSELAAPDLPSEAELKLLAAYDLPTAITTAPAPRPPSAATPQDVRQNMRRADALLKEAGWIVENGKRVKSGELFTFEILIGAPEEEKIALHFKRALDKMGIDARIRVLDSAAFRGRMGEYNYDMVIYHWLSSLSPGTEQNLYWSCKAANEPARWNYPGICDPAIDALAASIPTAKTREELVTRLHALDRLLLHGHYMIPLYYAGTDFFAHKNTIKMPSNTALYGAVTETWWMDQPAADK